jgi:hypothetical protein
MSLKNKLVNTFHTTGSHFIKYKINSVYLLKDGIYIVIETFKIHEI